MLLLLLLLLLLLQLQLLLLYMHPRGKRQATNITFRISRGKKSTGAS
jgi:hypothetical protein